MTDWIEEKAGTLWSHPNNANVVIEACHVREQRRGGPEETYEGFQVRLQGKPMAAYRRLQDAKRAASLWAPFTSES